MAFKQYTLTFSGVAQRLSDVYPGATPGVKNDVTDIPYRQILLQADPANAAVVYIGDDNTVSATDHAIALDPTQATAQDRVSIGPFETGPIKLSDFWVLGTNAQRLMVGAVPF